MPHRLLCLVVLFLASALHAQPKPNVVLIYCDDMGYGDLGCYGSKVNDTPTLDRLAREGVRFTDFYVSQAVCSASRAALLTGCYPNRVGIGGALGPSAKHGINPNEMNLAIAAKRAGMKTAIFGKWHLGRPEPLLPVSVGFDEFFGVPYSHDMWPRHPETPKGYPDLPLMEGTKVLRVNPDPSELTGLVTQRAVSFIDRNKGNPFFLYVPHPLPHVPLGAGEKFKGKSRNGLYGDVMSEIDDSVRQILDALKRNGLEQRTIVLFASDNGPWTTYGEHAGSAGPLREAKGTSFDGGVRVPLIAWGPAFIAGGKTCSEPLMTIDILPTLARLWGVELPKDRIIDGVDIWPQLSGADVKPAKPVHEALYIYWGGGLEAVRSGKWKIHFPHNYRMHPAEVAKGGIPNKARVGKIGKELFDMEADPGESKDVSAENPEVVKRLEALAEKMRDDLGDSLTKRPAKNAREPGKVPASGL